jgi:DNA-binding NarL/FixJ family response regulator
MARPRIVLADDHGVIMQALGDLLDRDYDIVAAVGDGLELVDAVRRLRPDVIVADMNMPRLSGLDALRQLTAEAIESRFVFLTMDGDSALAAEAFRTGAAGYLLKHSATEELHLAIQEVLQGRSYVSPQLSGAVTAAPKVVKTLASRGN